MVREPTKTDRGRDVPSVRQVSVFTENRVGALAQLLGTFDTSKVRILALAVIHAFDCAIVRFVFSDTDAAAKELAESNYRFTICDLVAVEMPAASDGLIRISKALLGAEIDIHYCYALITSEKIRGSIVVHVDKPSTPTSSPSHSRKSNFLSLISYHLRSSAFRRECWREGGVCGDGFGRPPEGGTTSCGAGCARRGADAEGEGVGGDAVEGLAGEMSTW